MEETSFFILILGNTKDTPPMKLLKIFQRKLTNKR